MKNKEDIFYREDVLDTLKYLDSESDFLLETANQISNLAYRLHTYVRDIDLQELVYFVNNSKIKQQMRVYTNTYEDDIKTHYEYYMNLLLSDVARVMYGYLCIASKENYK
tara:strand:- start:853 stop:1182 length:330 start_codon:yes stop_codon:yes gene_type:complete